MHVLHSRALARLGVIVVSSGFACSSPPVAHTPVTYRDSQPASSPAFEYLPRETRLVIAARSPAGLATRIAWPELTSHNREIHERAVAEVTQLIGHDLLDPDNLPEIGLDPHKAFGMALVSPPASPQSDDQDDSLILFAAIADHDKLQTAVYRAAGRLGGPLVPQVAGSSLIIAPRQASRWQLVIRGQTALLVLSSSSAQQAEELARTLATIDIGQSLAAQSGFATAMTDLRFGQDLAGYTVVPANLGPLSSLFGIEGNLPVAFGAELSQLATPQPPGELAVHIKAFIPMAGNAAMRKILRNRTADQSSGRALLATTTGVPLFLLTGNIDSSQLTASPLARALGQAIRPLGVDFMRELAPLLAGELGMAITSSGTGTDQADTNAGDPAARLGIDVMIELADPRRAAELLTSITKRPALADRVRPAPAGQPGQFVVSFPGWKDLYIGITGTYFHASTSRDYATRLGRATPGSAPPGVRSGLGPAMLEFFAADRAALRSSLAMELLAAYFMTHSMTWQGSISPVPGEAGPDLADGSKVPFSEEYDTKKRALDAARQEASQQMRDAQAHAHDRAVAAARAFGAASMRVTIERNGLAIHFGQVFGSAGLTGALAAVRSLDQPDPVMEAADVAQLELRALDDELAAIRARDIAEYQRSGKLDGDDVEVTGKLDRDVIRRIVRHSQAQLRACYERELIGGSSSARTVQTVFTIGGNGRVLEATASGGSDALNACVVEVFKALRFPTPRGGEVVKVKYPVVFRPAR